MSIEEEIRESVDEAKAPGTFNIVNVLQGRGYPKTTVQIILDEQLAYDASVMNDRLKELDSAPDTEATKAERIELIAKVEQARKSLIDSSYTIHLEGIPEGKREELFREARKKYPIEYEARNDIGGLLSGQQRVEKESPERDALFTDFLWLEHIKKIVDPSGNEQNAFTYSIVKTMRESFPISATMKINEAIEKLRTSTAVFIMETDEDFLAKP